MGAVRPSSGEARVWRAGKHLDPKEATEEEREERKRTGREERNLRRASRGLNPRF